MATARSYVRASGLMFLLVAIAHAWRVFASVPVTIGATALPMWPSWLGIVVTASLAAWALRLERGT